MTSPAAPRYARDFPVGTVCADLQDAQSGLRGLVARGPLSFCGYVGAPENHALYALEELNFECHHGINFRGPAGPGLPLPTGWYYFGWDYAHYTDRWFCPEAEELAKELDSNHPMQKALRLMRGRPNAKDWTVEEVTEDVLDALLELRTALEASAVFAQALRAPMR